MTATQGYSDKYFLVFFHSSYGPPKSVQSDQGTEFKGEVWKFLEWMGIKKAESRPRHPQSQGKIERSHATWKKKLRYDLLEDSEKGIYIFFISCTKDHTKDYTTQQI